ncbi:MAG: hypothetical protein LBU88_05535 [Treponema sp.]|nr:hypothetical protein [Treponema sp.]
MTDKAYEKKVKSLGGVAEYPSCTVDFPKDFRINTKKEALDLMDILISNETKSGNLYTVTLNEPFTALREFMERVLT